MLDQLTGIHIFHFTSSLDNVLITFRAIALALCYHFPFAFWLEFQTKNDWNPFSLVDAHMRKVLKTNFQDIKKSTAKKGRVFQWTYRE